MNKELQKIFNDDQKDRHDPAIRNDATLLTRNDKIRKKMLQNILREDKSLSAKDYYLATMIFHHGSSIQDSIKAVKLSETSYKLGYKKALSLYATCLDRLLLKRGKEQKFGTQYQRKDTKSKWKLLPVDSQTTDEERKKYNIAPLKELLTNVEKLNNND